MQPHVHVGRYTHFFCYVYSLTSTLAEAISSSLSGLSKQLFKMMYERFKQEIDNFIKDKIKAQVSLSTDFMISLQQKHCVARAPAVDCRTSVRI